MKKLLILNVNHINDATNTLRSYNVRSEQLFQANIVIAKTPTHFRCIKNRFDISEEDEKIPIFLLTPYLMRYKDNFTVEELMNSLL